MFKNFNSSHTVLTHGARYFFFFSLSLFWWSEYLNLFFTRLLFLYYADDSEIFKKNQFLIAITDFSEKGGSDLKVFFNNLY